MNIYDIAEKAGVSIATVSRVVNDSPKVSPKTKEKVRKIMEECEYTPNAFARGLGFGSMKTVGIICPDISDTYMAKAVACLEHHLHAYGYNCILGCSGFSQEEKESYVSLFLSKKIDALVLVGSVYSGDGRKKEETDYLREAAARTPVFLMNAKVSGKNIYCACADDYQATYEVTKSLLERGHRKILFLYDTDSFCARQKIAGYEAALAECGSQMKGSRKRKTKNDILYVRDQLLDDAPKETFDSVLATEDGIAVGALKFAREKNYRIPEEMEIVGYNNSILSISCEPALTSVDNKAEILCQMIVEHMIQLLEQGKMIGQNITVPCEIIKRGTTR